ncbi:hypothetical protein FQN54_005682 [Arachnomyces sp. PD_36]|nr:hypothetical protein FQN54_005682 [Arachnomyces sp. PD_36]
MAPSETKQRLALAIVDFLGSSLKDGTLSADDAESIEIAQSCIADTFKVDPSDQKAVQEALGGQSLVSIYSVYEKLKGRTTASTTGSSSASEGRPATPAAAAKEGSGQKSAPATAESDKLKSEGNAAMAKKDYPSAITKYTEALTISPGNPIYLSNRAAAYSASGNHSRAAQDAEAASTSDPKYTKAWSRLGLARFALGDAKGAAEAYQKGIDAEGNGGSDAMRKGLETSKKRIEEMERAENEPPAEDVDDASGAAARGPPGGAGGMPDLSALAGMLGGGGGGGGGGMPDLSSIMSNPMFASMAQNLMSNPEMMGNLMNNPRLREMAGNFGGAGGEGGGAGGAGGMPDMSSLMNDPSIAEMARNLMGPGAGRGAGGGTQ